MALPVKNALYATMANALQSMAGILVVVLLAGPWAPRNSAGCCWPISFTAVFAIVIEFGFRWYATKEVSQQPGIAARIAGDIFNAQMLLALAATVLAALAARILDYPPRTMAVIAVIWVSAILVSFTHVTRSLFRGLDIFPCDMAISLVLFAAMVLALHPAPVFPSDDPRLRRRHPGGARRRFRGRAHSFSGKKSAGSS